MFAMVCPDIDIAFFKSSKNMKKKHFLVDCEITQGNIVLYQYQDKPWQILVKNVCHGLS